MTSVQKKARIKIGQIKGTKPSLYNKQLLVSTGIPSLDAVIGGGLGVGTILMVEEDTFSSYSRLMVKYFVAEAVLTQQAVLLSSADYPTEQIIKELPAPINDGQASTAPSASHGPHQTSESGQDKMKIAWRYQTQPKFQRSMSGSQFGHYYDLTRTMDADTVKLANIQLSDCPHDKNQSQPMLGMNAQYQALLREIKQYIDSGQFGTAADVKERNVLRIAIHSLGSPQWGENGGVSTSCHGTNTYDPSLALFLTSLKAMLRSAFAVALITVPTGLFYDAGHVHRIERMCDTVIRLESFAGSEKEKNPAFKEYHGLLHLLRLPRVNSLVPAYPETTDLAFKLRRKKFVIEKLHLPPELSDTTGRSQDDSVPSLFKPGGASGCQTQGSSRLDF